jgi:hypothetical protein
VPRLSRAVLCLLVVLGLGSSATPWDDRDEATAAQCEVAIQAPVRAAIAIDEPPAPRAIAIARAELAREPLAPAPAQPPLSLAPKTSPPRC